MSSVPLLRNVHTLSFRLAGLYALLFIASVGVLGAIVYWAVENALEQQLEARIDADIALLQAEFRTEGLGELIGEVGERIDNILDDGLDYLVVDASGTRLAGNLPSIPGKVGWSDAVYREGSNGADRYRVNVALLDNGVRLAVGDDLRFIEQINRAVLRTLGWLILAILILSLAGGLILGAGFLRRVDAINRTAEAIIAGDFKQRIPQSGTNDSVDQLSANLNRMLDRIESLMESLRQVSINVAHELKTPLTRLLTKLETTLREPRSALEYQTAIRAAVDETNQTLRTFSALLRIAQIESGSRRAGFRRVDLSALFTIVAEDFAALAEEGDMSLSAAIEPGITIQGDEELLTQMLANLLENAIQHTQAGSAIRVALQRTTMGLVGSVADNGVGVPEEELERIFQRFYRLARSDSKPGSGLGLALVAAVADIHGIALSADNATGLRISMTFRPPD